MTKIYSPEYYIRIFNRVDIKKTVNVINPTNVLSIEVNKDLYQAAGTWAITFDYRDGTIDDNGWFLQVEPMDYVEIYIRREPVISKNSDGVDGDWGFGVYKKSDEGSYTFVDDFSIAAVELVENASPSTANLSVIPSSTFNSVSTVPTAGLSSTSLLNGTSLKYNSNQRPLNVDEKVQNPYFVYSGYVDKVINNFNITNGTPNNSLVITGRGVEKILQEHSIFFNIQESKTYLAKQAEAFFALPNLKPAEAIGYVLLRFFLDYFDPEQAPLKTNTSSGLNTLVGDKFTLELHTDLSTLQEDDVQNRIRYLQNEIKNDPNNTTAKNELQNIKDEKVLRIIYNQMPAMRNIYWALDNDPKYNSWGRLISKSTGRARTIANVVDGPLWATLQRISDSFLNEFFVDETGNIVLRLAEDAWSQTKDKPLDATANWGSWYEIKNSEIHSWSFTRSDDQLKTLVQVIPVAFIAGTESVISGYYGQSPLTNRAKDFLFQQFKSGQVSSGETQVQIDFALNDKRNQLKNKVSSYSLDTDIKIQQFFQRFGVRPLQIHDIYHFNLNEILDVARTAFTRMANNFWTGVITVKGDQKYKIGRIVFLSDINAKFYCHGVQHSFKWGAGWTTTLQLTRGEVINSYTNNNAFPIATTDTTTL